jgi:hypothetical protein
MQDSARTRIVQLASQAAVELDSAKLLALVQELNALLESKPQPARVRKTKAETPPDSLGNAP